MKTYGIIDGQSIQLTEPINLQQGSRVEIEVRPAKSGEPKWGDGLLRCMGILVDWTEEDDRIFEELAQDRQRSRYRDLDLGDDPE